MYSGRGAYTFKDKANILYYTNVELIHLEYKVHERDITDGNNVTQSMSPEELFHLVLTHANRQNRPVQEYDVAEMTINQFMRNSDPDTEFYPPYGVVCAKTWDGWDIRNQEYFDVKSHEASHPKGSNIVSLYDYDKLVNDEYAIHKFFVQRGYVSHVINRKLGHLFGIKVSKKQFKHGQYVKSSIFVLVYHKESQKLLCLKYSGGPQKSLRNRAQLHALLGIKK